MSTSDSTSWTTLRAAAAGDTDARAQFATRYAPVVRKYLAARWRNHPLLSELDDATQETFLECLRDGGALERAQPDRPGGFRAYLYGVVRNVALRFEKKTYGTQHADVAADNIQAPDETLSRVFDRAWAESVMQQAAQRQTERAASSGPEAQRRVELLRLRFQDNLPIREIAKRWNTDPATLHREYAKARVEFRAALLEVLAYHHPTSGANLEPECTELLALLG